MSQYDRFTLEGGLDLSTPYIKRTAGSLLESQNFECDTDGGYRVMKGYERYDGSPSPSEAACYVVTVTPTPPANVYRYGDLLKLNGEANASVSYIRTVDGSLILDPTKGNELKAGDTIQATSVGAPIYTIQAVSAVFPDIENIVGNTYPDAKLLFVSSPNAEPPPDRNYYTTSGAEVYLHDWAIGSLHPFMAVEVRTGTLEVGDTLFNVTTGLGLHTIISLGNLEEYLQDFDTPQSLLYLAQEARRARISFVPGSGPIRGVWDFKGKRYAFRDNEAGNQGIMYSAQSFGWQVVSLGFTLKWDTRPGDVTDLDLIAGDVVRGATSGAMAQVGFVGYLDPEHSAGFITFISFTGTFTNNENLVNNATNKVVGVVDGVITGNTLPPGGYYRFFNHNFSAGVDKFSMYGVNGVGRGFVFDGLNFSFVNTGLPDDLDKPFEVTVHNSHLFYAFQYGSLQHSVVGSPLDWSGGLGALELGLGAEITDLILTPKSLIICTEKNIQVLLGLGLDDWTIDLVTSHTGVRKFTGQYQSQAFVVARPGLLAIDRVDSFGNFADATISDRIRDLIAPRFDKWGPAMADKTKSQYRIYGNDGLNLVFTIYQGELKGIMVFRYDRVVVNYANPNGRVFFVSDDDEFPYVYEADVGVNNDGEERVIFLRTSYANQGDPDTRKRFRRAAVSLTGVLFREMTVSFTFSKGKYDTPNSFISDTISGAGGRWSFNDWDRVYWDGPDVEEIRKEMEGVGSDVSMIIYQSTRAATQYILEDVSYEYDVRRKVR